MATPCTDQSHRSINYLRVSVTDRCNLRCVYCMPAEGVPPKTHDEVLRYEEIARLVRVAAGLGIGRVRLTGGEPLVRRGVVDLVARIAATPGIDDISMTTNGTLLAQHAADLARAGLRRVNVSLDTLDPDRFRAVTRLGRLEDALAGIRAAADAGLAPIKINVVVMGGGNDDEVAAFARRTVSDGWNVRFIEVMPIGEGGQSAAGHYVSSATIRAAIEAELGPLEPATLPGNGPARYWRVPGAPGTSRVHQPHQPALLQRLQPPAPQRRRQAAALPVHATRGRDRRPHRPPRRRRRRRPSGAVPAGHRRQTGRPSPR